MTLEIKTQKRIANEIKNITKNPIPRVEVYVSENNILDWYYLIVGIKDSPYEKGYYIAHIKLPKNFPDSPPDYFMLTPSGRFHITGKICNDNSGYHTDNWSPSWTIRNIIIGFISIMASDKDHGIGHLKDSKETRLKMANDSFQFNINNNFDIFKKFNKYICVENNNISKRKNIEDMIKKEEQEEKEHQSRISSKKEAKKELVKNEIKNEIKDEIKSEVKEPIIELIKESAKEEIITEKVVEKVVKKRTTKKVVDDKEIKPVKERKPRVKKETLKKTT